MMKISELNSPEQAFNAGGSGLSKSLKPIKETVASMLQLQSETAEVKNENPSDTENSAHADGHDTEQSLASDKYPAPSTPQLERGRSLDVGDCQDKTSCAVKKESDEHDRESTELRKVSCSESKSVENTCINSVSAVAVKADSLSSPGVPPLEEEVDSADGSKTSECNASKESIISSHSHHGDNIESSTGDGNEKKASAHPNSCGTKTNKKKTKVIQLINFIQAFDNKVLWIFIFNSLCFTKWFTLCAPIQILYFSMIEFSVIGYVGGLDIRPA